jgi:APA family basic amino acid/polyamine antiporter
MAYCDVVLTGLITVIAAVSYVESAMFPKAGGQYVYIKEAYTNSCWVFIWMEFFAVFKQVLLLRLVLLSKFAAYLFPLLVIKNICMNLRF